MNVLITGATGFIGTHLVDYLLKDHALNLILPMRTSLPKKWHLQQVTYLRLKDLNAPEIELFWERALKNVDVIIHLAAMAHVVSNSEENPLELFRKINVEATEKLLRTAKLSRVKKFIFISSIGVHGKRTLPGEELVEDSELKPQDFYAISKVEAESKVLSICENSKLNWIIIRPSLVYGNKFVGNLAILKRLIEKKVPLPFKLVNNKRHFLDVNTLNQFIKICIYNEQALNQSFLLADTYPLSTKDLIINIGKKVGLRPIMLPVPTFFLRFLFLITGKKTLISQTLESLVVNSSKAFKLLKNADQ